MMLEHRSGWIFRVLLDGGTAPHTCHTSPLPLVGRGSPRLLLLGDQMPWKAQMAPPGFSFPPCFEFPSSRQQQTHLEANTEGGAAPQPHLCRDSRVVDLEPFHLPIILHSLLLPHWRSLAGDALANYFTAEWSQRSAATQAIAAAPESLRCWLARDVSGCGSQKPSLTATDRGLTSCHAATLSLA